jgi:phosphoserine phosphatase
LRKFLLRLEPIVNYVSVKFLNSLEPSRLLLSLILFGLSYNELLEFSLEWLKKVPLNVDVLADIKKFKRKGAIVILLTATLEFVAEAYAKTLKFDDFHATSLEKRGDRIIYVKERHLFDTKYEVVKRKHLKPYVYFTDSRKEEKLIKNAEKAVLVSF